MPRLNIRQSPNTALRYWRERGARIHSDEFKKLGGKLHDYAFTVAGSWRLETLEHVRRSLEKSLAAGESFAKWKKRLLSDPAASPLAALPRARLNQIFRTNLRAALMAGQWNEIQRTKKQSPFLQYDAILDARVRPEHAELDGRIYRADDPVWKMIFPPNGYNCRCTVLQVDRDDMKARRLKLARPLSTRQAAKHTDPSFRHLPGENWRAQGVQIAARRLQSLPPPRAAKTGWERMAAVPEIAAAVRQDWLGFVRAAIPASAADWGGAIVGGGRPRAAGPLADGAAEKLNTGLAVVAAADIAAAARHLAGDKPAPSAVVAARRSFYALPAALLAEPVLIRRRAAYYRVRAGAGYWRLRVAADRSQKLEWIPALPQ